LRKELINEAKENYGITKFTIPKSSRSSHEPMKYILNNATADWVKIDSDFDPGL
jgi:hypothetical protein